MLVKHLPHFSPKSTVGINYKCKLMSIIVNLCKQTVQNG